MKYLSAYIFVAFCAFIWQWPAFGMQQSGITQTVRGQVVDQDVQSPLIGVNVVVANSNPIQGASTDNNGRFAINNVPVGRVTLQVSYIGYEPVLLPDILITSGKEVVLTIEMIESVIETEGVTVVAEALDGIAVNEMASVSARSFSVEQTQRYAASISDPARMAQTFAGVSGGGDDLLNEIVIRGNSPRGILWRLEGIEIPNPNHFGEEGASGGGVSMLSASTLTRSDFFTGAFPAEYGNASSGVFDLFLRNGNLSRREYTFQVGVLGVEASVEGPFSRTYDGSYLINYRYSTLGVLNNFGVLPDESIQYQDLSFKFTFPTQKSGYITLFGLGGDAQDVYSKAVRDSTQWERLDDGIDGEFAPKMGAVGASHLWLFSDKTHLKTVVAAMGERRQDNELLLVPSEGYRGDPIFVQDTRNWAYRAALQFNHKFTAQSTVRIGVNGSHLGYNLVNRDKDFIDQPLVTFLDQKGTSQLLQGYLQFKYRPTASLTLTPGVHYTYFALTENQAIEPRLGLTWSIAPRHVFSAGIGLHSRVEPMGIYLVNRTRPDGTVYQPHRDLDLMQSWHFVAGYDLAFQNRTRLKVEAYYQSLLDVPVTSDVNNPIFASINAEDIWDVVFADDILVNEGTGRNMGVELTLEKYLEEGFYYLFTGSLYDSQYTPLNGETYSTRYDGGYVLNMVAGKEFSGRQNRLFGVNARFIVAGGNRYTPLDRERSIELDRFVFQLDRPYSEQVDTYVRLDVGLSYTINRAGLTHALRFDIQNITGRENVQGFSYNSRLEQERFFHAGLIPILSYQITF